MSKSGNTLARVELDDRLGAGVFASLTRATIASSGFIGVGAGLLDARPRRCTPRSSRRSSSATGSPPGLRRGLLEHGRGETLRSASGCSPSSPHVARSGGMTVFFTKPPHAYAKKSWQGSAAGSIQLASMPVCASGQRRRGRRRRRDRGRHRRQRRGRGSCGGAGGEQRRWRRGRACVAWRRDASSLPAGERDVSRRSDEAAWRPEGARPRVPGAPVSPRVRALAASPRDEAAGVLAAPGWAAGAERADEWAAAPASRPQAA